MATIGISGLGLTGVLRMTWVQDQLVHVVDHSQAGETSGTWTGLACPAHGLSPGADVDNAVLQRLAAHGEIADLTWETPDDITAGHGEAFQAAIQAYNAADTERAEQLWEQVQAIWSRAWSLNYAALELLQHTGLTRFSPVKPQQWVVASFEHHTSPHSLPQPHIHNIVITNLTTAGSALLSPSLAVISPGAWFDLRCSTPIWHLWATSSAELRAFGPRILTRFHACLFGSRRSSFKLLVHIRARER